MNRREFIIKSSAAGIIIFVPQRQRAQDVALPLVPVIVGALVVVGGVWATYKLYRLAKDKLYPPPPVPQPPVPPPGSTNHIAMFSSAARISTKQIRATLDPSKCMGDMNSENGLIYLIDVSRLTPEESLANALPDGSQSLFYATMPISATSDLKSWNSLGLVEMWISWSCYVARFGGVIEQGTITAEQPMFVTLTLPDCCGPVASFKL